MHPVKPSQIDAILPQTQCGLCGHGGCMPYAESIVNKNAAINLCPPGGVATLKKLGTLLNQDPAPFIAEMKQQEKPLLLAVIREDECIGCTKCIVACPVDAILGSAKQLHSVITNECTGCELCIAPCPVDCIDMVALSAESQTITQEQSAHWRKRYQARNARIKNTADNKSKTPQKKSLTQQKNYIEAALERVRNKK